jgi:hypothetical protein
VNLANSRYVYANDELEIPAGPHGITFDAIPPEYCALRAVGRRRGIVHTATPAAFFGNAAVIRIYQRSSIYARTKSVWVLHAREHMLTAIPFLI